MTAGGASLLALPPCHMSDNPPPSNYNRDQVVRDGTTGALRVRRADEFTRASAAQAHERFIIAAPIGVRLPALRKPQPWSRCDGCYSRGSFTSDRQVSIRASAKPGRGGVSLRACDFKCSKHVYAMISRQSPNIIWLEVLKPSDPAVKAFARRDKLGYPDQRYLDHGDTFDAFLMELDLDRTRKDGGFFQSSVVPKKKEEVGSVYPSLLELEDIHTWVLESTRCRLALCSVQASHSLPPSLTHSLTHSLVCILSRSFTRISPLVHIDCPIWARFKASGEQDLDGFEDEEQGEEEDDDEPMTDDDREGEEAAASFAAELEAAEQEVEGEEGIFARGPVDALAGFFPSLSCLPAACPAPRARGGSLHCCLPPPLCCLASLVLTPCLSLRG